MGKKEITFKVTLELDEKWARSLTAEDVVEHTRSRASSSMWFKDQVKKSGVVAGGTGNRYRGSRRAAARLDPCQS